MKNYVMCRYGNYVKLYSREGAFGRKELFMDIVYDLNSATVFGMDAPFNSGNYDLEQLRTKLSLQGYIAMEVSVVVSRTVTIKGEGDI